MLGLLSQSMNLLKEERGMNASYDFFFWLKKIFRFFRTLYKHTFLGPSFYCSTVVCSYTRDNKTAVEDDVWPSFRLDDFFFVLGSIIKICK